MATATLVTSEQFLAMPDVYDADGNAMKQELIAGDVISTPHATARHDIIENRITRVLGRYLDAHPELGLDVLIEPPFLVSPNDTNVPDVAVLLESRVIGVQGCAFEGPPDIAVEVVSPSDTAQALKNKIKAYLENGSKTVWVFYDDGSVMVHSASQVREVMGDEPLEDALVPGFSVPVSTFFKV